MKEQKDLLTPLCRAVLPHLSLASTLAPLFNREYTQSVCPLRTDSISGVLKGIKQNKMSAINLYNRSQEQNTLYLLSVAILNIHSTLKISISNQQTQTF